MRALIALVEGLNLNSLYLHGSAQPLALGTVLEPRGQNLVDGDVEDLLEQRRPPDMPSRLHSVYMTDSYDDLETLAVNANHIYAVEPLGPVVGLDHAFVIAIWRLFAEDDDELTPERRRAAEAYADLYWSGEYSDFGRIDPPQMEYLTASAKVVAEA